MQLPVWRQLFAGAQFVPSSALFVVHVPAAPQTATWHATVEAEQAATLQQTPSVQNTWPDDNGAQSAAVRHAPPGCCPVPHLLALVHTLPPEQSALVPHDVLHVFDEALHAYGMHAPPAPGLLLTLQLPAPSHSRSGVKTLALPPVVGHECGRQTWVLGYFSHAPFPSQAPSFPQDPTSALPHRPVGSGCPEAMEVHMPRVVGSVHDTHAPSQATLQQTLCPVGPAQTRPFMH